MRPEISQETAARVRLLDARIRLLVVLKELASAIEELLAIGEEDQIEAVLAEYPIYERLLVDEVWRLATAEEESLQMRILRAEKDLLAAQTEILLAQRKLRDQLKSKEAVKKGFELQRQSLEEKKVSGLVSMEEAIERRQEIGRFISGSEANLKIEPKLSSYAKRLDCLMTALEVYRKKLVPTVPPKITGKLSVGELISETPTPRFFRPSQLGEQATVNKASKTEATRQFRRPSF